MDIKISKIEHKGILLKAYSDLMQVEEALELILKKNDLSKVQFAILGKLDYAYLEEELEKASRQKAVLKKYWDQLLGEGADFGFFSNPEIGTVFIVGPLSTVTNWKD